MMLHAITPFAQVFADSSWGSWERISQLLSFARAASRPHTRIQVGNGACDLFRAATLACVGLRAFKL